MHTPPNTPVRSIRPRLSLVLAATLGLAGLASGPVYAADAMISPDRCETNKAAGNITFLTSFAYAASAGILDVVAAKELGYFKDYCLDVTIQPGGSNIQLVSANTAQIAGIGAPSDTMIGIDNGADIEGIATYGNEVAIELITMADSGIKSLDDFVGKTVGYKIAIPPQVEAMFLDNGVDTSKINWVSVGFDPSILPAGQVEGLAAYKSNEPRVLESQGLKIDEWDPAKYGVKSAFNTQIVNKEWAAAHPTAVEDFLRASMRAFNWINASDANLDTALGYAEKLSTAGYNVPLSKLRWQTEMKLIKESQPAGWGIGMQSVEQWQPEADMLVRFKLVKHPIDVAASFDNSYISSIYDGTKLIEKAE